MSDKKKYLEYGIAGAISLGLIYFALKAPLPSLIQTPQTSQPSAPQSSQSSQQSSTPQSSSSSAPQCSELQMGFGNISLLQQCFPNTVNNCGFPSDVIAQGFCEYAWDNANYYSNKPPYPGLVIYNPYYKWFAVFAVNSTPGYYPVTSCSNCNISTPTPVAYDIFNVYPSGYTEYPSWAIPNMIQYGQAFFYTQSGAYVDFLTTSSELQYIYNNNIQVMKTVVDPTTKGFELGLVNVPANGCLSIVQTELSNIQTVFPVQGGIDFPLWYSNGTQIQFCYGCSPNNCKTLTPMPV
jgi:hypothetical protein